MPPPILQTPVGRGGAHSYLANGREFIVNAFGGNVTGSKYHGEWQLPGWRAVVR